MSTGVCNQDIMSHFPFSTVLNKDIQMERRRFSTSICPPDWDSSHCGAPDPPLPPPGDPLRILEKRAPTRNGAQSGRHLVGHGRLARSQVPHSGARGAPGPWESFYHSLSAIHKQPTQRTHRRLLLSPLLLRAAHISIFMPPPSPHTHISSYCFAILELLHSEWAWRRPGCRARSALKRLLVQLVIAGIIRV